VQLDWSLLAAFSLLWLAIVPTPGPNTLLVVHLALTAAARDVALALAGKLLAAAPSVRLGVYLLGGAYLVRAGLALAQAGVRRRRAGAHAALLAPKRRAGTPFGQGVLTALANVQALFFLTSIFASAGILTASPSTQAATVVAIVLLNGTYLALLAWLLQRPGPRAWFARHRPTMEIAFGVLFIAFGARLIGRELAGT